MLDAVKTILIAFGFDKTILEKVIKMMPLSCSFLESM
jgi:hypothetical protein